MDNQIYADYALNSLLSSVTDIDIVFEEVQYDKAGDTPFIEVRSQRFPKLEATLGTDGLNRIDGIYRLYVSYPKISQYDGSYNAEDKASTVAALYKRGTYVTYSNVTVHCTQSSIGTTITSTPGWVIIPVTVDWYAFITN